MGACLLLGGAGSNRSSVRRTPIESPRRNTTRDAPARYAKSTWSKAGHWKRLRRARVGICAELGVRLNGSSTFKTAAPRSIGLFARSAGRVGSEQRIAAFRFFVWIAAGQSRRNAEANFTSHETAPL